MGDMQVEFLHLETDLVNEPENLTKLTRMVEVCQGIKKSGPATGFLRRAMAAYSKDATSSIGLGMKLVDLGLSLWKNARYNAKDTLRVNIKPDRARLLSDLKNLLMMLRDRNDPALQQQILFKLACVQENLGMLQEAITIMSDLIAQQAMDGVELTYIILKASVILKHLGNHDQAIEYLEFLLDDPPVSEGYGKTHILAFLALTYDQHPKRQDFVVVLRNTYEELLSSYSEDLAKGNRPMTNQKKIEKMLGGKSISQSSEVWEMLSLQAVDRCEYIFAFELMQQAVDKAPGKYKLLHLMSEVSFLLGYEERSVSYAEAAFAINSQSTDLRALLLLINPKKWQDKLRNVAPVAGKKIGMDASGTIKLQRAGDEDVEEQSWLSKLATGGPAALFTSAESPESKARKEKIKKEKEKRREIKQARKVKKEAEAEAAAAKDATKKPGQPRKKRDPMVDGPARPEKPLVTIETKRLLDIAREGKGLVHFYDNTLRKYSEARHTIDRAERQWKAQQKAMRPDDDDQD